MPLKKDQIIIRITPRLKQKIEKLAKNKQMSMSEYIRILIENEVNKNIDDTLKIKDILLEYFKLNEELMGLYLEEKITQDELELKLIRKSCSELEASRDIKGHLIKYYIDLCDN